ncbi:MAG: hypothetical protein H0T46_17835 [Deltaproteobacteria bacterium]|nr:hypothetical protein [Deltaproteobacteria bacterium]
MAIITFLFSFLSRKAGDIVQAVFGWSVSALFGKLPRKQNLLVTGALVLSLAWPFFVVGTFYPKLANWAIAMAPLHDWIGETAMRGIWIGLAVITPMIVGLLVHFAAPNAKGNKLSAMLHGYPLALGFFAATVVVLITVPIVKVASLVRGWSEEHVYLQPQQGEYEDVLAALAEASGRAGFPPKVDDVPGYMVIATTIMRTMAKGAVSAFVGDKLRRVTSDGVQMYLYPGDMLMRGKSAKLAHIRAMFSRTKLDSHAYLVEHEDAKHVQDELQLLNKILDARGADDAAETVMRFRNLYQEMMRLDIPYEQWAILESMARRFERRLLGMHVVSVDAMPLDVEADASRANNGDPNASAPAAMRVVGATRH